MNEKNICAINFVNYKVNELHFKLNENFKKDGEVNLSPEFTREISKSDNDKYIVTLAININGDNLPFELATRISGYFNVELSGFSEQLIQQNAVAILFPYLRSLVSSLTVNANINPVILPTLNIVKMFQENPNEEDI